MKGRIKKDTLTTIGGVTLGFIAGKMTNKIGFIGENPLIGGGLKVLAGVFLGGQKGIVGSAAIGLAVCGVQEAVNKMIPTLGIAGYLNPSYSDAVHYVAGGTYDGGSFTSETTA